MEKKNLRRLVQHRKMANFPLPQATARMPDAPKTTPGPISTDHTHCMWAQREICLHQQVEQPHARDAARAALARTGSMHRVFPIATANPPLATR